MTFDFGCDLLTSSTKEASHVVPVNQVWFQFDLNFSIETNLTFSVNFKTWPQMTLDLEMWHLTSSTNEGSHLAPMTQVWLKSIEGCGQYRQMYVNPFSQTTSTDNYSAQSDPYVSFLLRQATQKSLRTILGYGKLGNEGVKLFSIWKFVFHFNMFKKLYQGFSFKGSESNALLLLPLKPVDESRFITLLG